MSHSSATKFLRGGEKYYIYFVNNLLLSNSERIFTLTFDEVIAKIRHHIFFETQCIYKQARVEKYFLKISNFH